MNKRLVGLMPIADGKTKILILGSFPSAKSLAANEYYVNPRNQFWKILSDILSINLLSIPYKEKIKLLSKQQIGLWDVVKSCKRKGSSDNSIKEVRVNEFKHFLKKYPNIKVIFLNGYKAYNLFTKHVDINIEACCLPSTSPARTIQYEEKRHNWAKLLEYLQDIFAV